MQNDDLALTLLGDAVLPLSDELAELAREAYALRIDTIEPTTRATYTVFQNAYNAFCGAHNIAPFEPGSIAARRKAGDSASTLRARRRRNTLIGGRIEPTGPDQGGSTARYCPQRWSKTEEKSSRSARRAPKRLVATIDDNTSTLYKRDASLRLRDRALVLFSFACARQGAEIADLDVGDLSRYEDGWVVRFRWSKTNKSGEAEYVGIPRFDNDPLCALAAMEAYLKQEYIHVGPLFRTRSVIPGEGGNRMRREDVSRRLDKIAARAGLPGVWRSHSFRRGFVTEAESRNIARSRTRIHTGWKNDAMFSVYAHHWDKIAQSPLHEIYGRRQPPTLFGANDR